MENSSSLKRHHASEHPSLPLRSIDGFRERFTSKRQAESDEMPAGKRVKFTSSFFVCSHCGAAFATKRMVELHSNKVHSRIPSMYVCRQIGPSGDSGRSYFKCEFCQFVGEPEHLDAHVRSKHKNRVTCGHCSKRFEFATKLKAHHDVAHKNMPFKFKQELEEHWKARRMSNGSDDSQSSLFVKRADLKNIFVNPPFGQFKGKRVSVSEFSTSVNIEPVISLQRFSKKFPAV